MVHQYVTGIFPTKEFPPPHIKSAAQPQPSGVPAMTADISSTHAAKERRARVAPRAAT